MCMKKYMKWANKKIKKFTAWDVGAIKLAMLALGLMLAVLIPELTTVAWYWYLIIAVVVLIRPIIKFYIKK